MADLHPAFQAIVYAWLAQHDPGDACACSECEARIGVLALEPAQDGVNRND